MTGVGRQASAQGGVETEAVFVHSWFRSGSTWLWKKFRDHPGFCAYYEPLNEELPAWTPERLKGPPTRAFEGDNHPALATPYYFEYLDLVEQGRLGFDQRNSYERYLLEADESDETLARYLQNLIDAARASALRPALCFCRSQLRAGWMKRQFGGLHIAQIRNPWDQWKSFARHPYFNNRTLITAYCIERRRRGSFAHVTGFAELVSAWENRQTARLSEIDCFAVYITLWLTSSIHALASSDMVIDTDQLGMSSDARRAAETELQRLGLPCDLSDCRKPDGLPRLPTSGAIRQETEKAVAALATAGGWAGVWSQRGPVSGRMGGLSTSSEEILQLVLA